MSANPLAILDRLELFGIRLGLDRSRAVLAAMGDVQRRVPCVLVAGTNGKGSTSTLLAAMATAAGYRTGLYTSPHLEEVEERLRIDGIAISADRLGAILTRVVGLGERLHGEPPTYFEALTLAAFEWFAAENVELAILEVGLGGRLDATNVAEPELSLVTRIGFDHQARLGFTLESIASEKAGILRAGRPAISIEQPAEAARALAARADELGADLTFSAERVRGAETDAIPDGQRVHLATSHARYALELHLAGAHQVSNATLAVLAAETLAARGWSRFDRAAIEAGAAAARWPGRLERVDLGKGRSVLLDAAHNPDGAAALADRLAALEEPHDLLFGCLDDKDAAQMLPLLARRARRVVLTRPSGPRGRDPRELLPLLPESRAIVEPERERALDLLLAAPGLEPGRLLVLTGSIHLIGELRRGLRERLGVPAPAAEPLFVFDSASEGSRP